MFYYLNNFFIFSIFGYFFESIIFLVLKMHNESGFLHLIWTPFYGIGVVITILLCSVVENLKLSKIKKVILLGILLFSILTFLEYVGGVLLTFLYGYSLWTYEHIPLHVNKYISIPTSTGWMCFSFLYIFLIKKYSDKLVKKIPKFITISLTLIFVIDNIITILQILKFRNII